MSRNRIRPDAGYVNRYTMPRGPNGLNLCRQCKRECANNRRTFCGKKCVHEWKLRSSPTYVRRLLRKRDKGVCARCRLDTRDVEKALRTFRELAQSYGPRPAFPEIWVLTQKAKRILKASTRRHFWDADHITAVVDGGGECGLDNYQTLCIWCHRAKSADMKKL